MITSSGGRWVHNPERKLDWPPGTGGKSLEINKDGFLDSIKFPTLLFLYQNFPFFDITFSLCYKHFEENTTSFSMNPNLRRKVLIDAREFVLHRSTGIRKVLEGITDALAKSDIVQEICLLTSCSEAIPPELRNRKNIKIKTIPTSFVQSEKTISDFSRQGFGLYISPYPKLPLFGLNCKSIHTIHDILDLTHPAYKRKFRLIFDRFRLKRALHRSSLTWYDSAWSRDETRKHFGFIGKNPRVRFPGLDAKLKDSTHDESDRILSQYGLQPGYVLVVGNGKPHKNLGILLNISDRLQRQIVFVGVSERNQQHWKSRYESPQSRWISYVTDDELKAILRRAFCLAQPSTAEGYGYPPLEAMACGVPTVISRIPVLVETTGGNTLSADHHNPEEWIEAFQTLEDNNVYQNQVERGQRWIKPLLGKEGWENHLSDIKEVLDRNE